MRSDDSDRKEFLAPITPRVARNHQEARGVADERRRHRRTVVPFSRSLQWPLEGRRTPCAGEPNGIALVAVLWVLVLLSVMAGDFLRESRSQTQLARNLLENARARALAEAGVHRAIFDLLDPKGQWQVDGTVYGFPFGEGKVSVSIQDEGGKINLNRARDELLQGLFVVFDLDEEAAAHLVDAIADFRDPGDRRRLNGAEESDYRAAGLPYRPKNAPFEAVDELHQVIGIKRKL